MRVLVTGNLGYIGTVLVPMLKQSEHSVRGLDSALFGSCAIATIDAIPTINKDVREVELADLEGLDAVVHLAGLSNDPLGEIDPELTYDINHRATVRLAELAKRAGISRFVYASSCSVYGSAGDMTVSEESERRPVTPYARSKEMSERDLSRLADADFCPVYLRPATAFGVSPMIRFDLVLNNLVAWTAATGKVHLKSDGMSWRPLVHIEDISRAILQAVEAPAEVVHNQAFNVGRKDENYRIRELAEIVQRTIPGAEIEYADDAGPDKRSYHVKFDKLFDTLPGYQPRWTSPLGAQQIFETIRKLELSAQDFEGARYSRLNHLQKLLDSGELGPDMRWPETKQSLAG